MKESTSVRVRIAPSPTGPFHIGTARTALFNWLFARKHGGAFIVRIEDTDRARSEKKFETEIFEGLRWLGLDWDEGSERFADGAADGAGEHGPYRQSERTGIYKNYLEKLLQEGKAYYCYCTKEELDAERKALEAKGLPPKYGGRCRDIKTAPEGKNPEAIRFKIPETEVAFEDVIRRKVKFNAVLFGDIVIAKNLAAPLYNFAVVVDDAEMRVSHVIRGEDHISNTPKQILLQRALGFPEPAYAHLPLILNPDRSKMSKRFSDTALLEYKNKGFLPEAIVNFLALLGWHPKGNEEIFSRAGLIEAFDLFRVQKSGAIFNEEKLGWLAREHMKRLPVPEIADRLGPFLEEARIKPGPQLQKIIELQRGRAGTLREMADLSAFFFSLPDYAPELLVPKDGNPEKTKRILLEIRAACSGAGDGSRATVSGALDVIIKKEGRGAVLWPLRVAVSGLAASPDPLEIIEILGLSEAEKRIGAAALKLDTLIAKG